MRESLDVDILIVGGGPAGMSAALRLAQLQEARGGEPLAIAVLEKALETGAHMLSGAVLDPSTLKDLIPDFEAKGAPLAAAVERDDVYLLTRSSKGTPKIATSGRRCRRASASGREGRRHHVTGPT